MKIRAALTSLLLATGNAAAAAPADVTMTWVEKYLTFSQDHQDQLHLTDAHFLAEIIFDGARDFDAIGAGLYETGTGKPLATYAGDTKRAFTNGYFYARKTRSFGSPEELERRRPADITFTWRVTGPRGDFALAPIRSAVRKDGRRSPAPARSG